MRRQICWVDRLEDGVKREVNVSFINAEVVWKIKWSDPAPPPEGHNYAPTSEDWEELQTRAENWYQRRALPFEVLKLIKTVRAKTTMRD